MLEMLLELKEVASDDFLDMGKDLINPEWGPRYFKYSAIEEDQYFTKGDYYIGEWSTATNEPHGRGIQIDNKFNCIRIGYINNGDWTGKYIFIWNNGDFLVGENTSDADGRKHVRTMEYYIDGTSEQFDL